jgi:hypothetical protein
MLILCSGRAGPGRVTSAFAPRACLAAAAAAMAEQLAKAHQYEYRATANLVLQADRYAGARACPPHIHATRAAV